MHPFEVPKPDPKAKLNIFWGMLVCAALPVVCWAIPLLLRRPEAVQGFMLSVILIGAAFFCVSLLTWCNSRHLFASLPLLYIALILFESTRSDSFHSDFFFASALLLVAVLVTGGLGMVVGSYAAQRTAHLKHPAAVRTLIATALLGLLIGPSTLYRIGSDLAARRMERPGPASLKANATTLVRTVITPVLDTPLDLRTNVIWCGTMQLAWNELSALVGEDIRMTNQGAVVSSLNRASFAKADADPDTCVVAAARADDRAMRGLRSQVARAFKGAVTPELIPDPASLPQNAFILYAALFVNLPFEYAFNRLEQPFFFCGEKVAAFGTKGHFGDPRQESKVRAQVNLCDFRSPDDFVVTLRTKRTSHQLILAKVPPSGTLADTAQAVLARMPDQSPSRLLEYKALIVPIADYDLARDYPELVGRPLTVKNPLFTGFPIEAAVQGIRFRLDERGALLRSEGLILTKCASALPEGEPPDLIFDKPFLVLLKCATSAQPYFAMWVDNAEILMPFIAKTPPSN